SFEWWGDLRRSVDLERAEDPNNTKDLRHSKDLARKDLRQIRTGERGGSFGYVRLCVWRRAICIRSWS
ncbi:MAG: hypothetical protein ACTTIC_08355, partial [Helicobacteraceae bacterium]